jgi:hypothetical protein
MPGMRRGKESEADHPQCVSETFSGHSTRILHVLSD